MKVTLLTPRGYCFGVRRAIEMVLKTKSDKTKTVVLGEIVHNKHVTDYLRDIGVFSLVKDVDKLDLLDEINDETVIITAHGASKNVFKKMVDNNISFVDATCPMVYLVHSNIEKYLKNGYKVIYIGKNNHPEVHGILGISDDITLISKLSDINFSSLPDKTYITNQTTLSPYDIKPITDALLTINDKIIIESGICNETKLRQEAVVTQEHVDLMIVVGDKKSSNSNELVNIGNKIGIKSVLVENVCELDNIDFSSVNSVSITSGASTPDEITNEVYEKIKKIS